METKDIRVAVAPLRVTIALLAMLLLLLVAHAVGLFLNFGLGYSYAKGLVPLFNIATEGNIPTFYASSLLMLNALLFLFLWRTSGKARRGRRTWLLLSITFAFLSVDEFAMIHELLIKPVRQALDLSGVLFFAWILPYTLFVLVLGIVVGPFIWSLGSRFRLLFGASAALYLSGAIFVEMLGGRYYEAKDETVDLTYRLFQTTEETLEFCGLILLTYTLLEVIRARAPSTRIHVEL